MPRYSPDPSRPRSFYRSLVDPSSLSFQEFEEYISFLLQELGYSTQRRGMALDPDGGVDIDAWLDGRHVLVQCKRYDSSLVHHAHVRDLLGAVVLESAASGLLVFTGRATDAAYRAAAASGKIELIDSGKIKQWQKQAAVGPYLRPVASSPAAPGSLKDDQAIFFPAPDLRWDFDGNSSAAPDLRSSNSGSAARSRFTGSQKLIILALVCSCVTVWCCSSLAFVASPVRRLPVPSPTVSPE